MKALAPPKYSPEFERFWAASGNGSKSDANKAWQQVGRPEVGALIAAWETWDRVAWVDGIGRKHVATWLRAFDWQQYPKPPARRLSPAQEREARNAEAARVWLSGGSHAGE